MTAAITPAEPAGPVRVLVVEDSRTDSELICRMLCSKPGVKVAAAAATGRDALILAGRVHPHIMILDLNLPDMAGLDVIEETMAFAPIPILVLSAVGGDKTVALEALARGAVEVMGKPELGSVEAFNHHAGILHRTVTIVARARVITHPRGRLVRKGVPTPVRQPLAPRPVPRVGPVEVVGIAASTGGPNALRTILADLPTTFPVPVLVVQHIAVGFTQGLVDWLDSTVTCPVHVAVEGTLARPGHIYLADEGAHLEWRHRRLVLRRGEPVGGHIPSADVMLASLAADVKEKALAVVLTGMGRDGAQGARSVFETGGTVIAQDEATSAVYGMPKAVAELGAASALLPLHEIAAAIRKRVEGAR